MAKKSTLRYILLGLLNQSPMSGYDLNQVFGDEIGEFWQAQHSQIYPELAKMETAGLITHHIETVGTKLEKKIYCITETGQLDLKNWLNTSCESLPVNRDEFVLKLYFIQDIADPILLETVSSQLKLHEEKLAHLENRKRLVFPSEKEIEANYGHFLILDHGLKRERDYVSWLTEIIADIEQKKRNLRTLNQHFEVSFFVLTNRTFHFELD
ncbi:transcriptional regulator [Listeria floridensis FSL S10-1187]|uniref:Transcriptional regulator n=1 Tax=Listeria floridensis FSL S10-1187 TaxID=1265817 RepID=A0ABP3AXL4_9LIST|nr:PadR family transcriptional regulator [Listeria floridensis]EUJ31388.1 transcriptional regulator [Listeria floridensis FSL S10-1187]